MSQPPNDRAVRERLFDELYRAHRQTLHAFFVGRTSDAELALDLVQDTFVRVWRSIGTVADVAAERQRAWVFSIARNLVIDQYRAQATRRVTAEAVATEAAVGNSTAAPADADLAQHERRDALDRAIWQLPVDLRTVLALHVLGERTSSEIGEVLGRPAGTVRYQLAEARRRLAHDMQLMDLVSR